MLTAARPAEPVTSSSMVHSLAPSLTSTAPSRAEPPTTTLLPPSTPAATRVPIPTRSQLLFPEQAPDRSKAKRLCPGVPASRQNCDEVSRKPTRKFVQAERRSHRSEHLGISLLAAVQKIDAIHRAQRNSRQSEV